MLHHFKLIFLEWKVLNKLFPFRFTAGHVIKITGCQNENTLVVKTQQMANESTVHRANENKTSSSSSTAAFKDKAITTRGAL